MKSRTTHIATMLIAMLCAATLPGCSDPKAAAVGTYELDKESIKAAAEVEIKAKGENDPSVAEAAMMLAMIDSMTMTMTLNADGTATMAQSVMGQAESKSGTWTISGKTVTITHKDAAQSTSPLTGTISGDTITMHPPKGQDMPFDLVFKRKKA